MLKVTMECRYSLLALLMFLSLVHPCTGDTDPKTVMVFEDTKTEVFEKQKDNVVTKGKPLAFGASAFVSGKFNEKEFLAVISDAVYAPSSDKPLLEPVAKTSNGDYRQWSNANVIVNSTLNTEKQNKYLGKVTAVMTKDKIYVLATTFDELSTLDIAHVSDIPSDSFMIIGTLKNSPTPSNDADVTIVWDKLNSLKSVLNFPQNAKGTPYIVGGMGNGVVMNDGTIVLPIQIYYKDKEYDSASIIYSDDEGVTWHMGKKRISGASEGSLVEFGEKELLFAVQSSRGSRAVYKTNDMGATWKTSETFMEVWGNEKTRSLPGSQGSVITAPVEEKDVLLFSHPLSTDKNRIRDTLQLWVSDGQRIALVGTISEDKKGEHTGNSILAYVNKKLYITHEINPHVEKQAGADITGRNKVIAVTNLQDYFEHVQKIVLAWRALDKKIVRTGESSADGLVGVLGNAKGDEEVWPDKYNCVNATVKGATPVKGGFSFSGKADSGAQWPVASQGQNQLYKFTRKQFTLAARVKLHLTGGTEGVSLLGAAINSPENTNFIGIGCSDSNKWYILHDTDEKHVTNLSCELETEYHIAFTFAYGVAHFYLDGSYITKIILKTPNTLEIKHFFLGSTGTHSTTDGKLCTVKNVMLFNHRLEQTKIFHISTVTKKYNLDDIMESEETTPLFVSQQLPQATEPATIAVTPNTVKPEKRNTDPLITNSVQKTQKPGPVPVIPISVQTTKPAITPANDKTLSTKISEQTSVTEKHKMFNASETDKHLDNALGAQQTATLKKHFKPTDSSAKSFAFFQLMCVVYSVVLLAQV